MSELSAHHKHAASASTDREHQRDLEQASTTPEHGKHAGHGKGKKARTRQAVTTTAR